jgi:glycosyltransferase involved in cell wall biosynthesis
MMRAYSLVRDLYHAAIPHELRIKFWAWRRRQLFLFEQYREDLDRRLVAQCQAQVRAILVSHPEARGTIIFPPSAPWSTELFQRPQQMALAFASLGYVVLYWVEAIDQAQRFRQVANRLYLCRVPPAAMRVCERPMFIAYTYNAHWARPLRSPVLIYEVIDHLDIFSDYPRWLLRRQHRRLLWRAQVVVGTADDLLDELKPYRPDAILCPNGVDPAHFAAAADAARAGEREVPDDLRSIVASERPIIGYYGAMAQWFDFDLVKHAAEALPECQFVLIGPDYDGLTMAKAGIETHPNIHWLGPKKYAELPRYLACFDVATIPFKVTAALNAVSPIKLFEYMAGGRPIVTTDLAECRKYPVVLAAHDQAEWVSRLREALALRHDEKYLAELRRTAEANTWQSRAETILAALSARSAGRGYK